MPIRDRRDKASDVFKDADFVFVRKAPFEEALPMIANVVVRYREEGNGVSRFRVADEEQWSTYSGKVGEYIDCSNPLCYGGGFSIGDVLRRMVAQKENSTKGHKVCKGYEGSPKGRRNYGMCCNMFYYEVEITYRDAPTSG